MRLPFTWPQSTGCSILEILTSPSPKGGEDFGYREVICNGDRILKVIVFVDVCQMNKWADAAGAVLVLEWRHILMLVLGALQVSDSSQDQLHRLGQRICQGAGGRQGFFQGPVFSRKAGKQFLFL